MSSSAVKPRRVKSAKARLTPTQPPEAKSSAVGKQQVSKEVQERVPSAKAIRDKQNASAKVFPRPESRASKERFASQYSKDFEGSYAPAAELRPTSPTRRHNPHPGKVRSAFIRELSSSLRKYVRAVQACYEPLPLFVSLRSNSWCGDYLTEKSESQLIQRVSSYHLNTSLETAVGRYTPPYYALFCLSVGFYIFHRF